uniref:Uncharacterized protein n=1 Tax=Stomoxys calcitrans TaxID=35570 RepID=A0A1I8PU46_STOCA|nr:unnamed protein product [Stomoxys calcitrans]
MSESLRCSKPRHHQQQHNNGNAGGNAHHHSIPHKFSSIVNKVESLIHKINHDKPQNSPQQSLKHNGKGSYKGKKPAVKKTECIKCDLEKSQSLAPSLDSLNNLSDNEVNNKEDNDDDEMPAQNGRDHQLTDSDDAEIAHITGTTAVQVHRRIELDQLTDETIREFNEQCSSLSHDMEFYNSWQNEEELEKQHNQQQLQHQQQQQQQEEQETSRQTSHHHKEKQKSVTPSSLSSSSSSSSTLSSASSSTSSTFSLSKASDTNNNNAEFCDNMSEDPSEWLDKHENDQMTAKEQNNYGTLGRRPLTHIQQIVNDLQQNSRKSPESPPMMNTTSSTNNSNSPPHSNSDLTAYALNQLPQQNANGSVSKTRRSSVASSGSMGRMETIVEEPSENKISVKEILQRFETMNKNEVNI